MNFTTTLASLTAAALFCAAPLQEALKPIETPLTASEAVHDFDAAAWAQGLRAPALDQRKRNYEELLQAARGTAEIQEQLRAWAADESDVELAWTAHLMLRELESRAGASLFGAHPFGNRTFALPFEVNGKGFPFGDAQSTLDSLFDDLRLMDPLRSPSQGNAPLGPGPFRLIPHGIDPNSFGPGSSQQSSGVSVEIGPNGVKVQVEETVDGKTETKTYEADSMEELLETNPELKDRMGSVHLWGSPNLNAPPNLNSPKRLTPLTGLAPFSGERDKSLPRGLRPMEPSLDQLGVRMLTPDLRSQSYEGVAADVGLQVVDVVPGSLADAIGIRPDELVISIAGQPIKSADDVRAALKSCSLDKRIDVECVDESGKVRVRSWKPVSADDAPQRRAY